MVLYYWTINIKSHETIFLPVPLTQNLDPALKPEECAALASAYDLSGGQMENIARKFSTRIATPKSLTVKPVAELDSSHALKPTAVFLFYQLFVYLYI